MKGKRVQTQATIEKRGGEGAPPIFSGTTSGHFPNRIKVKSKGGAPKGNRNAFKHGLYAAALEAFRREVRHQIMVTQLLIAEAHCIAAGYPPRHLAQIRPLMRPTGELSGQDG